MKIGADLRIGSRELDPARAKALRKHHTVLNPEYTRRLRCKLSVWRTPKHLQYWAKDGDDLVLPRGSYGLVADLEHDDWRTDGEPYRYGRGTLDPRPYQQHAAEQLLVHEQGVVVAACGAGKTVIATAALRGLGRTGLVVVHTADLAAQWSRVLERELGIQARRVGGGAKRKQAPSPITIATVQALARLDAAALAVELDVGVLVVDEAHHTPASTFAKVVGASPARYRWALTATPERADGLDEVLGLYFGDVVARISPDDLIRSGVLVRPCYRQVETGFGSSTDVYNELVDETALDEGRDRLIGELAREAEGPILILVARVEHADALAVALGPAGVALTGETPHAEREAILASVEGGRYRYLVATTVADEGLDLPCLRTLILATPGRAAGRLEQRIGRVCRSAPGKDRAVVLDLVDDNRILKKQARERAKIVKGIWP